MKWSGSGESDCDADAAADDLRGLSKMKAAGDTPDAIQRTRRKGVSGG